MSDARIGPSCRRHLDEHAPRSFAPFHFRYIDFRDDGSVVEGEVPTPEAWHALLAAHAAEWPEQVRMEADDDDSAGIDRELEELIRRAFPDDGTDP